MSSCGNNGIDIIFEDNHLLVVKKPVNIPTQKDKSNDSDMLTLLKEDIKKRYNKPGNVYLGLVHRLDRPVGGVMVFAKTSKAASRLSDQVRTRQFKKVYLAVVHGILDKLEGRLENYLLKDTRNNTVSVVKEDTPGGKLAVLDYKVEGIYNGFSLVKVSLHTGRPHQIRVQLANIGHPLYGEQIALWSSEIAFVHPVLKQEMIFSCEPPEVEPWTWFNRV